MDFAPFDTRGYPTLSVREGYGEWAATYEATVPDLLDIRLLERLAVVNWPAARHAVDLACGSGRTAAWLRARGVGHLTGVDVTPEMLALARGRGAHDRLLEADATATGLSSAAFDLAVMSLADEHLRELAPLYREARRLLAPGGAFVLVGYHPEFLMQGVITHFDRPDGTPAAIESHVHLLSDHAKAALAAGLSLAAMDESVVDAGWLRIKPKWRRYEHRPVSFSFVWRAP